MLTETAAALAAAGGTAVVQAMPGDGWETAKGHLAELIGRGDATRTGRAAERLERSRTELRPGREGTQADVWKMRLEDFLDENPDAEPELRDWVRGVRVGGL